MKRWIYLALVVGLGLGDRVVGGEVPCQAANPWRCMRAFLTGCPDDYCRKPWPRFWCVSCGQPDDYCPKPGPRLWTLGHCNLPDDYCRKPCPDLCRPLCPSHYTCGCPVPCRSVLPELAPAIEMTHQGMTSGYNQGRVRMASPYHPQ